jgi:cellulose synthase/poly-beta-1,6-N-acetylglucosamine synthase-like glycosyltransferase
MSDQRLRLHTAKTVLDFGQQKRPLGRHLVETGVISPGQLVRALEIQSGIDAPLGEILIAEGTATPAQVMSAVARQHGLYQADLQIDPPNASLVSSLPPAFWLHHRVIPWMRLGPTLVLATARPDRFDELRAALPEQFGPVLPVVSSETQIMQALARTFATVLAASAEARVPPKYSCRHWDRPRPTQIAIAAMIVMVLLAAAVNAPMASAAILSVVAVLSLSLISGLKAIGFGAQLLGSLPDTKVVAATETKPLPKISVMVPLFHETEIAGALVRRLEKLIYPKALLDVILVLEEKDTLTRDTLANTPLPAWMRVVEVPDGGGVTTKPRALNYALDFCRGEIIGIWDAEDAPAPDQLGRVAEHFAQADDDVVCLQGILDYYNPQANWLARCFTIEYASWFRIVLPGIARLGLVVPLGGTTLFIKRHILEELGGWDAHNVTEDADLGVRITRFGYRTELIRTVTQEEANCRLWPWIKQRSRWLKGFMVTYLVHMRHPRHLLRDIGLKRFLGMQAFFLGTLSQFLLAPVLWSFWMIPFGYLHPLQTVASDAMLYAVGGLFLATEFLNICLGMAAVSGREHRKLIPWTFTMMLYFPLGALAAYKALYELVLNPFYWDKTQHGQSSPQPVSPN